jgi:hypothetical protein
VVTNPIMLRLVSRKKAKAAAKAVLSPNSYLESYQTLPR